MTLPVERLACPVCRGALNEIDGDLRCLGCAARYAVENGMPLLVPPGEPVARYETPAAKPHKGLRASRAFAVARRAYQAMLRADAALHVKTPLDPDFHLARFRPGGEDNSRKVVLDVGAGSAPYRQLISGPTDE